MDSLIYLTFMKLCAYYFFTAAILSNLFLTTQYVKRQDQDANLRDVLNQFTLINGLGDKHIEWLFYIMTLVISIVDHIFLVLYKKKIQSLTDGFKAKEAGYGGLD